MHSDLNECANRTSNACHGNADCINTAGYCTCSCRNGYQGNGLCAKVRGFKIFAKLFMGYDNYIIMCADINECANQTSSGCHENADVAYTF